MKKKGLVLLLAGVTCAGCFAACDKKEEGGSVGNVTQEQWTAAFENIDLLKATLTEGFIERDENGKLLWSDEATVYVNVDKIYGKANDKSLNDDGTYEYDEDEWYMTEIDGVSYEYRKDWDEEEPSWKKCENEHDFSDSMYNYQSTASIYVEYAKLGLSAAEYDAEEDVYLLEMNQGGSIVNIEIQLKDGAVYQLDMSVTYSYKEEGELFSAATNMSWVFEETSIALPDQEGLNALLAAQGEE